MRTTSGPCRRPYLNSLGYIADRSGIHPHEAGDFCNYGVVFKPLKHPTITHQLRYFFRDRSTLESRQVKHLVGNWMARYGEMSQARLTLSFHCFSVRLMYLDLQLAMLVSTDCSMEMASSWVDRGLYQVISRSISLAWTDRGGGCERRAAETTPVVVSRRATHQQRQQERPALHVVLVKLRPPVALLGGAWNREAAGGGG